MAVAAPIVTRIVLRRLAIPVGELAGWAVVLGLIFCMDALIRGFAALVKATVGGLPLVGGLVEAPIKKLNRVMIGLLGAAEERIEHRIAGCLSDLARLFVDLSNDIIETARAIDRLSRYVAATVPGPTLHRRLAEDRKRIAHAQRTADRALDAATRAEIALDHPTKGKAGVSTKVATRPLAQRITRLERTTDARLDALEHGIAVPIPRTIPRVGSRDLVARREIDRLRKWVERHQRVIVAGAGVGLVVRALAKLKLGWLRCTNVRSAGRAACAMDARRLASLLDDSLMIVGTVSLVELARELGSATELVTDAVHSFVREQ